MEPGKINVGIGAEMGMCGHPEWHMKHPGTAKPASSPMFSHCECGQNYSCRTCGWGAGSWPCRCSRERQAELDQRFSNHTSATTRALLAPKNPKSLSREGTK